MSAVASKHWAELKKMGETVAFAAAVLWLTFLAFVTMITVQTNIGEDLYRTDTVRLIAVAGILTGLVFACGVLLGLPVIFIARRAGVGRLATALAGGLVGLAPAGLLLFLFGDSGHPHDLSGYLTLHGSFAQLLLEVLPYFGSGAALGWFLWKPKR